MNLVRVLIVDDSSFVRKAIAHIVAGRPGLKVVGSAASGEIALELLAAGCGADIVTLDINMPGMGGLATLSAMREAYPSMPVIMVSSETDKGHDAAAAALARGAVGTVFKPAQVRQFNGGLADLGQRLLPVLLRFGRGFAPQASVARASLAPAPQPQTTVRHPEPRPNVRRSRLTFAPSVLAIGISTGGPDALARLLPTIPEDFPMPIVIVQHMPPTFTRMLSERLDRASKIRVKEAADGDLLKKGTAYLAPGDFHMAVDDTGGLKRIRIFTGPLQQSCRPAVDVLFRSVAQVFGASALALVMTGMGADGTIGSRALKAAGASIIVQDEASSVVWGMPGSVVKHGLADRVMSLNEMIDFLQTQTQFSKLKARGKRMGASA